MTLMVTIPDPKPASSPGAPPEPVEEPEPTLLSKGTTTDGGVKIEDLTACCALGCCICSLYSKVPDCIGTHSKGQALCMELECLTCKSSSNEGSLCICCKNELECIKPTVCIKLTAQVCCVDNRCSVPCDEEVPPILACLGLTCCKDYKCDPKCGDGVAEGKEEKEGGGAPATEVIDRD
jgi:hypothetical protein